MTSFAFILGCVPLWTATGAGAVARQIMGTTVIGGMLAASAIGIFFVPAIFYMVEKWSGAGKEPESRNVAGTPAPAAGRLRCMSAKHKTMRTSGIKTLHERADGWRCDCLPVARSDPNYHRPPCRLRRLSRPSARSQQQAQAASYADLPWWQVFQDPKLQELIRTALKQNYDLQLATERSTPRAPSLPSRAPACFPRLTAMAISTAARKPLLRTKFNFL